VAEQKWFSEAVRLVTGNVAAGGGPFGAIIMRNGEVIASGTNQVTPTLDPTATRRSSSYARPAGRSATSS
jgi:tRNA(Arg) A34 adenosine deaminase TadA